MKFIPVDRRIKYQKVISLGYILSLLLIMISCASNERLNESSLLINNKPQDIKAFERLIWSRDKENVVVINTENLKKIYRNTKTSEDIYFDFLHNYSIQIMAVNPISKELSISERAFVAGHVIEYLYKCRKKFKEEDPYKDSKFIYRSLGEWNINNFNREFKMHDYYDLKNLKKEHLKYYKYFPDEDTIPSKKKVIE